MYIIGGYELSNYYVSNDVRQEACEKSLLNLFRHPWWWNHKEDICELNSNLLGPLGDFHRYDIFRGEWNVLISRDINLKQHNSGGDKINAEKQNLAYTSWNDKRISYYYDNNINDIPQPRAYHTLTFNGIMLYMFGGEKYVKSSDNSMVPIHYCNDLWSYDIKRDLWTLLLPKSIPAKGCDYNHPDADCNISAWVTRNGTKSTLASSDDSLLQLNSCENFLEFEPTARSGHTTVSYMENLYMYGGQNSALKTYFNDLWEFDTTANRWKQIYTTGPNPGPRAGHTALVISNFMCIYGGVSPKDKDVIEMSNYDDYPFADDNHVWFLNLQTFTWQARSFYGSPPSVARAFGRLYGFFLEGNIWLGGPTGCFDLNKSFIFSKINISSLLSQPINEEILGCWNELRSSNHEMECLRLPTKKSEHKSKNWLKKKNLISKQQSIETYPSCPNLYQSLYPMKKLYGSRKCSNYGSSNFNKQKSSSGYKSCSSVRMSESTVRPYTSNSTTSYYYSDPSQAMLMRPSGVAENSASPNQLDYWKYSWASSSSTAVGCFNSLLTQSNKNNYSRMSTQLSDNLDVYPSDLPFPASDVFPPSCGYPSHSSDYLDNRFNLYNSNTCEVAYILNQLINNSSSSAAAAATGVSDNNLFTTSSITTPESGSTNFHMRSSPEIRDQHTDDLASYLPSKNENSAVDFFPKPCISSQREAAPACKEEATFHNPHIPPAATAQNGSSSCLNVLASNTGFKIPNNHVIAQNFIAPSTHHGHPYNFTTTAATPPLPQHNSQAHKQACSHSYNAPHYCAPHHFSSENHNYGAPPPIPTTHTDKPTKNHTAAAAMMMMINKNNASNNTKSGCSNIQIQNAKNTVASIAKPPQQLLQQQQQQQLVTGGNITSNASNCNNNTHNAHNSGDKSSSRSNHENSQAATHQYASQQQPFFPQYSPQYYQNNSRAPYNHDNGDAGDRRRQQPPITVSHHYNSQSSSSSSSMYHQQPYQQPSKNQYSLPSPPPFDLGASYSPAQHETLSGNKKVTNFYLPKKPFETFVPVNEQQNCTNENRCCSQASCQPAAAVKQQQMATSTDSNDDNNSNNLIDSGNEHGNNRNHNSCSYTKNIATADNDDNDDNDDENINFFINQSIDCVGSELKNELSHYDVFKNRASLSEAAISERNNYDQYILTSSVEGSSPTNHHQDPPLQNDAITQNQCHTDHAQNGTVSFESNLEDDPNSLYQITAQLQAEAKRHREESLILKDAILLLIPFLNTNELSSVLQSMQKKNISTNHHAPPLTTPTTAATLATAKPPYLTTSRRVDQPPDTENAKSTKNAIADLLLECHNY